MVEEPEQGLLPVASIRQVFHAGAVPLGAQFGGLGPRPLFAGVEQRLVGAVLDYEEGGLHVGEDEGERMARLDFVHQDSVSVRSLFQGVRDKARQPLFIEDAV